MNVRRGAALLLAEDRQVMMGQEQDVLRALPQRRQSERDHVQAVKQILAETGRPDLRLEIAIGRRDQSDIRLPLLAPRRAVRRCDR